MISYVKLMTFSIVSVAVDVFVYMGSCTWNGMLVENSALVPDQFFRLPWHVVHVVADSFKIKQSDAQLATGVVLESNSLINGMKMHLIVIV